MDNINEKSNEVTLNIFDHIKNPEEVGNVQVYLQILKALPEIASTIIESINNRLDGKLRFESKKWIKILLNDVKKCRINTDGLNTSDIESSEIFKGDISDKYLSMFVEYMTLITNLNNDKTSQDYLNYVANNAEFICKLTEGQVFTFLDDKMFNEFTFIGNREITNDGVTEIVSDYCKRNTSGVNVGTVVFTEFNIYRPVLVTDPSELTRARGGAGANK